VGDRLLFVKNTGDYQFVIVVRVEGIGKDYVELSAGAPREVKILRGEVSRAEVEKVKGRNGRKGSE